MNQIHFMMKVLFHLKKGDILKSGKIIHESIG